MGSLFAARDFASVAGPVIGRVTSKVGLRSMMIASGLLSVLALLTSVFGTYGFIVGTLAYGFTRTGFNVAMNAWLGEEVAYERRARASGLVELSWGGSALIVLPLLGLAIKYIGWQAAPGLLGLAALPFAIAARGQSAVSDLKHTEQRARKPRMSRQAISTLGSHGLMMGSAQCLVLSHGLWLEDTYGFDTAQVGFAVVLIGGLEVSATLFSSGFTDRLGKRNSMVGGTVLMMVAMAGLLTFPAPPLIQGLALLMVAFLGFEFGIVSSIPLIAELDPNNRAGMFGWAFGVGQISRGLLTLIAAWLYQNPSYGFEGVMTLAIGLGAMAVILAVAQVREP